MNKFIAKIFRSAGVDAKVSKDERNPRFRVVENKLTLEGTVRKNRYTMMITDNTGRKIDTLSVAIENDNDVVNRINESINTLKMLSKAYDQTKLIEEDEEFDTVLADGEDDYAEDEPVSDEPATLIDGLEGMYNGIMDVADDAQNLLDLADGEDANQMNDIIVFISSLYDTATDIEDYVEELKELEAEEADGEDDAVQESVKRSKVQKKSKSASTQRKAIATITMAENLLRSQPGVKDILIALKDIKSELIVRGC